MRRRCAGKLTIDPGLRKHIESLFLDLNKVAAAKAFPPPLALSTALDRVTPAGQSATIRAPADLPSLFATAAVDMWVRAIHSLLVSASLTLSSPIWASVAGYYSSHYSIRGFAHLLGYFQLFRRKRTVQLDLNPGHHVCQFLRKHGGDREHKFYWVVVRRHPHFSENPLFTDNRDDVPSSDVAHRNRASYADHLARIPYFTFTDRVAAKTRLDLISQIRFGTPPIPTPSKFPDVDSVQIVAYHRIVIFRRLVDEVLGGKNRFWNVYRTPTSAADLLDFQLVDQQTLNTVAD